MTIEVPANKVVDFLFVGSMHVLKFVHGGEPLDIETVWRDAVGFALEQVFGFIGGDMRDGGENV